MFNIQYIPEHKKIELNIEQNVRYMFSAKVMDYFRCRLSPQIWEALPLEEIRKVCEEVFVKRKFYKKYLKYDRLSEESYQDVMDKYSESEELMKDYLKDVLLMLIKKPLFEEIITTLPKN